ncbi:hypothetical protein AERO9AM_20897 [Aeromicrobium sp. 9AM]|nr:hypothetical protein AERO9AM_20897 [Aeromicrobium sp. 9AM]
MTLGVDGSPAASASRLDPFGPTARSGHGRRANHADISAVVCEGLRNWTGLRMPKSGGIGMD